jgi:hypothetical protein
MTHGRELLPLLVCNTTLLMNDIALLDVNKVGMHFVGDVIDPEDGPVWRWQYRRT